MSTEALLRVSSLVRQVGIPTKARTIVDHFTYSFHRGQVYTILGPSGAGKSSLLRLLNRLDEPTGGEVFFENREYRSYAPEQLRRQIGYLFQTPYLFPGRVADNLLMADATLSGDEMDRLLTQVSLTSVTKQSPTISLSVGEKQRVALARLLATKPAVVLLDEPTSALDPTYGSMIETTIRQLASETNLAVIMVSHHPDQARRMNGEALLLVGGRLVESGPVADLLDNPQSDAGRRYVRRELT